jgi:plastocyanin
MRIVRISALGVILLICLSVYGHFGLSAQVTSSNDTIVIMDNCLPGDPGWNPSGGCSQKPTLGDVSQMEFNQLVMSPLISGLVGHPSWRNEPSHLLVRPGHSIKVTNRGGRNHTLTEVANFGGGAVASLNVAMTRAPECPAAPPLVQDVIPPGQTATINGLTTGLHKFQCCFHPWMRATVRVR